MTKIRLHIDSSGYGQKPSNIIAEIKPRLQSEKSIHEIEVAELPFWIEKGFSISPAIMKNGCKAVNWIEQRLFMIDIDNDKTDFPVVYPAKALEICRNNNLRPALYYFSYSHTEDKPKFRLCFVTDELITDINVRATIIETLISLFDQSDSSGKNADRIFFGTNKSCVEVDFDNRISLANILMVHRPKPINDFLTEKISKRTNIDDLKKEFDFYNFLKVRNGEPIVNNSKYAMFEECELCHHKRDLVYYHETNTFMCFSSTCNKGGSIIDYLMILKQITVKEAIEYFKHEILKMPKDNYYGDNRFTYSSKILKQLDDLEAEKNFTFDDKGMSKLFSSLYKNEVRFNTTANEWFYYNGKVWLKDERAIITSQKAEEFSDNLLIYSTKIKDEDIKIKFLKYVYKLGQLKYREILVKDSHNINFINNNDLDKNDNLFNCQNGTLNLKTFEFLEHNPEHLLSKISNVVYNPLLEAKVYNNFINEVLENDVEKIIYLQTILGYSLTADTSLETCFILLGKSTRNGKSTLMETFAYMLGNTDGYAMNSMPETIALKLNKDSRGASGDIARLNNCRFLNVSEPPKTLLIDNALLKKVTGRDTLTARHLQQSEFEFRPKFKLFINCNHLPLITDNTLFASNRINIITFNRHFEPEEQDIHLKDKLKQENEISGIFNWCLEGLKKFYQQDMSIIRPTSISKATEEYRKISDKIGTFIDETMKTSDRNVKVKDAYEKYKTWCIDNGYSYEGKSSFIDEIKNKNIYGETGTINGKTEKNVIRGYDLISPRLIDN